MSDYNLITEAVASQDAAAMDGQDDAYTASQVGLADLDRYAAERAEECAHFVAAAMGIPEPHWLSPALQAAFADGFVSGSVYRRRKDDQRS